MPPFGEDTLSQLHNVGEIAVVRQADPKRVVGVHGLGLLLRASKKKVTQKKKTADSLTYFLEKARSRKQDGHCISHIFFVENKVYNIETAGSLLFYKTRGAVS